jgi:hypothetical protein
MTKLSFLVALVFFQTPKLGTLVPTPLGFAGPIESSMREKIPAAE